MRDYPLDPQKYNRNNIYNDDWYEHWWLRTRNRISRLNKSVEAGGAIGGISAVTYRFCGGIDPGMTI